MTYYLEVNLIAIIVAVLLFYQSKTMTSQNETSHIILHWMLGVLVVFSLSDIAAYGLRGFSKVGSEIANVTYFIMMALGCYLWLLYICVKMGYVNNLKRLFVITGIPITVLIVAILLNPITGFFFTIDNNAYYHRGNGVFLAWIVEWGYILVATIINIISVVKEERSYRKRELRGYLIFMIPMACASIVQMLFYGTTTSQIGFMIALFMACSNRQSHLVQRDELTGINNRNAFLSYRDYVVTRNKEINLTLFMMDADNFKSINDNYGHLKGDQALKDIAEILKAAVSVFTQRRVILYRYAGDEFIIIGTDLKDEDIKLIEDAIYEQVEVMNNKNKEKGEQYKIGLSIGHASKICYHVTEFDQLIKDADAAMYAVKKARKQSRRG